MKSISVQGQMSNKKEKPTNPHVNSESVLSVN